MITVHYCENVEFREKATQIVLETLACLPETLRNIFVWIRYRGCSVKQIAERLDWKAPEIEAALDAISLALSQKTRALLFQQRRTSGGESRNAEESKLLRLSCNRLLAQRLLDRRTVSNQDSEPVTFWPFEESGRSNSVSRTSSKPIREEAECGDCSS